MINKVMEKCQTSLDAREMSIYNEKTLIPTRVATINKVGNSKYSRGSGEIGTLYILLVGIKKGTVISEDNLAVLHELPHDLGLLGT